MLLATIIFSARDWLWPFAAVGLVLATVLWGYRGGFADRWRLICAVLKVLGVVALGVCLLEPLWTGQHARPGANLFALVADNSQSLKIEDGGQTRAQMLKDLLAPAKEGSVSALEDNYEVRRFLFDTRLQSVSDFNELTFEGRATALGSALTGLKERFNGRPLAGVLVLTDGNATDLRSVPTDLTGLPPIYPVLIGGNSGATDVALRQVNITQTAFEDAPVSILAEVSATGLSGETVMARLLDLSGSKLQESSLRSRKTHDSLAFRFQLRPQKSGVSFYRLMVGLKNELLNPSAVSREATLLNNSRTIAVDRGQETHRVLYVAGRPNWEYKFLNRAVQEDREVQLVALMRIAHREAKFDFRGRGGETSNPLYRGFGNQSREDTERYDQPVLVRLNARDELELRGGFPITPEELYQYEAVILDDLESAFFTPDQAVLLQKFVSERGGGLLMLGGMESFQEGNYARTPIGDMLPVYLERSTNTQGPVRLQLSKEGWLQPWARLRENETDEKARLQAMPGFQVMNAERELKPGASVIATAADERGNQYPVLVTQRFGRGRTAAFTIGDLWRWGMQNPEAHHDLDKAWRQLVRWLVSDVPGKIELAVEPGAEPGVNLQVRARDAKFQPLDDAAVGIDVQPVPERGVESASRTNSTAHALHLRAEPSLKEPGLYEATYVPHSSGGYLARAHVTNSVGVAVGDVEAGWATDLAAEEFHSLQPNVALMQELALRTGGELVPASKLENFIRGLPLRRAPVMEAWTVPAWHTPAVFAFALACFVGEWGLRRWKGMP